MKTLIRSLLLLSLTAAPLAVAGSAAPASTSAISAVSPAADSQSVSVQVTREETALFRTHVRELDATVDSMRRELARFRDEEDARLRVVGDPDVHPNWP
jgi:septal ring factor EnvC (AmiA/AmiB activator)